MRNIPQKIYLQIAEAKQKDDIDFNELAEVSWCADKINDSDIVYYLPKKRKKAKRCVHPYKFVRYDKIGTCYCDKCNKVLK